MRAELAPLWPGFAYKEHQVTGINWMLKKEATATEEVPGGGILADEMGLGKTIQMVGLIRNSPKSGPRQQNLLVAPVAVLEQWKAVIRRSGMTVRVPLRVGGGYTWTTEGAVASVLAPQIYVIGYERVTRNPSLVTTLRFHRVIYDEAHRLGSGGSCAEIAKTIATPNMWLLTATPITNELANLKQLLTIIGYPTAKSDRLNDLVDMLKEVILCRTMDQLRATIPDAPPVPVHKSISLNFASEEEADFYRGMCGIIVRRWRAIEADNSSGSALEKLKLFMRLRQLSLHPQVYIQAQKNRLKGLYTRKDWEGSSTKFDAIQELLGKEPGQRWILFCHFRHEMEMLKKALSGMATVGRVQIYNGGLTAAEKEGVIAATHEPLAAGKSDVLLVQLQSGGVGLNLQHFNRIIFTGPWWTKALMDQAVGRAVRIGQRDVVAVYHICLKEEEEGPLMNIDKRMNARAEEKGALCGEVLSAAEQAVHLSELR